MNTTKPLTVAVALSLWLCSIRHAEAFYNPSTGRWLSRDPQGSKAGPNDYVLVYNAPLEKVDRLGLDAAVINAGGPTGHTMFLVGNQSAALTMFHFYARGHTNNNCCKQMLGICCDKAYVWLENPADWKDAMKRAANHGSPVRVWHYAFGTPFEDEFAVSQLMLFMTSPGYYSLLVGPNCHTRSYDWFLEYVAGGHRINVIHPPDAPAWFPEYFWVTAGRDTDSDFPF